MDIINQMQKLIEISVNILKSINFLIVITLIIIIYQVMLLLVRDRKYINSLKAFRDPDIIKIEDLNELPLINILIPAWKEGDTFRQCLLSITKLKYPYLKIFINAGGSEETINIAESFKVYNNFTIIHQKRGGGKIKAINELLKLISKGVVYLIDADIILSDQILLKIIHVLVNEHKDVAITRVKPHPSVQNIDLVKYININRNYDFLGVFSNEVNYISQNTGMKLSVIKKIGKFSEGKLSDDGFVMGSDILAKGIKIHLIKVDIDSFNYPTSVKDYFSQNIRWLENYIYTIKKNKILNIIKFLILALLSIYIVLCPIFLIFNIFFFLTGVILFLNFYLKRIRRIIFFKSTHKNALIDFSSRFYFKLIFYVFIDLLMNIIVIFEIIFYRKAYKKRKNLTI